MSISSLLGFVALAGWVAVIAGIGLAVASASQQRSSRSGITLAIAGLILGVLFTVISQGVIIVQPQEVAVVFDSISGDLVDPPLTSGIHIVIPVIQEATYYQIAQQEYTMSGAANEGALRGDDAVVARTSDGQEVRVDATIIYSINPSNANTIHRRWQNRYELELVRPTVRGAVRDSVSQYGVEEVYSSQRDALREDIESAVVQRFTEEGLIVTDFVIRDIQFSPEYSESVEQKQIAEQDRLRAQQEAETVRILAEGERNAQVERATGRADSVRIEASANAEAILVRAEADAQALALIREQIDLNPALVNWRYIESLSDNVELILLPSNSPFLFDFNDLTGGGTSPITVPAAPVAEDTAAE